MTLLTIVFLLRHCCVILENRSRCSTPSRCTNINNDTQHLRKKEQADMKRTNATGGLNTILPGVKEMRLQAHLLRCVSPLSSQTVCGDRCNYLLTDAPEPVISSSETDRRAHASIDLSCNTERDLFSISLCIRYGFICGSWQFALWSHAWECSLCSWNAAHSVWTHFRSVTSVWSEDIS